MERAVTLFGSLHEKAAWMDGAASLDALDPFVRTLARVITSSTSDPAERARRLHEWVRFRLWYSHDPWGIETTPDARVAIQTGTEDCDGKARVLVALVRAMNDPRVRARVRAVVRADGSVPHIQAEIDSGEGFELAETIVRDARVGETPRSAIARSGALAIS